MKDFVQNIKVYIDKSACSCKYSKESLMLHLGDKMCYQKH